MDPNKIHRKKGGQRGSSGWSDEIQQIKQQSWDGNGGAPAGQIGYSRIYSKVCTAGGQHYLVRWGLVKYTPKL